MTILQRILSVPAAAVRAGDWWDFKLVPILTIFYASAARGGDAIAASWFDLLTLLAALIPGAIYVSLLNDWTDIEQDAAAGKPNRLIGGAGPLVPLAIAACLAAGLGFCWLWRDAPLLLLPYLSAWVAFTFYSTPPLRLKVRGLPGLLADAAGSTLFPALLAAGLATRTSLQATDMWWLAAVGLWALAYGVRGILWHQLLDEAADRTALVRTFVFRRGARDAAVFGTRIAVPLELLGLLGMLRQLDSVAAIVALILYYGFAEIRVDMFRMAPTLVMPKSRPLLIGQEYYDLFLPVAILAGSAFRHPVDLAVLAAHLLCFPRRPVQIVRDLHAVMRCARARK